MTLPKSSDWMFALKTFFAAMLALWIALRLGLDRPYWAMTSAFIVSQPLNGVTRSKAVYRFLGTISGAALTIAIVPNLIDSPEFLSGILAIWLGVCVYLANLDRDPHSYFFLLTGYSVSILIFPIVDTPSIIWDVVIARLEEITLGIACGEAVSSVVAPRSARDALSAQMDGWVANARQWAISILEGDGASDEALARRQKVLGNVAQTRLLASQIKYDNTVDEVRQQSFQALRQRLSLVIPVLDGISDRLETSWPRDATRMQSTLLEIREHLRSPVALDDAGLHNLQKMVGSLHQDAPALTEQQVVQSSLRLRLSEFVDLVSDIVSLRRYIAGELAGKPILRFAINDGDWHEHRDHFVALQAGIASALAMAVVVSFWISTGWPAGAAAALLVGIVSAFLAGLDTPAVPLTGLIVAASIALCMDGVLLFAILPYAHSFEAMALAFLPFFMFFGVLASLPRTAMFGSTILMFGSTELALTSAYSADFITFANTAIASIAGLVIARAVLGVVRNGSATLTVNRLVRLNRRDIAGACRKEGLPGRLSLASLLIDRLSLMIPRLAAAGPKETEFAARGLLDLRIGINVAEINELSVGLAPSHRAELNAALEGLGEIFEDPSRPVGPVINAVSQARLKPIGLSGEAAFQVAIRLDGIHQALVKGYGSLDRNREAGKDGKGD